MRNIVIYRIKILNNIGVAFVKLGKYDEAISTLEHCMEEKPDFRTGLNMLLCVHTLEDKDRMREVFQRLLEIPLDADDEDKYVSLSVRLIVHTANTETSKHPHGKHIILQGYIIL